MKISMSHGAGGEIMQDLISDIILGNIKNKKVDGGVGLDELDDGASIPLGDYYQHGQSHYPSYLFPRRRYWENIYGWNCK